MSLQKNIFNIPQFRNSHIYEVTESPYKKHSSLSIKEFRDDKSNKTIGIIDSFDGTRPMLLNYEFLIEKKAIDLMLVHTLVLDSNIVDALHKYCLNINNTDQDKLTQSFLLNIIEKNYDYNPIFYVVENLAKSSKEQYIKTASKKLASILKLQSMDEDIFTKKNKIVLKKDALEYYCNKYNSINLDDCGIVMAHELLNSGIAKEYHNSINLIYVALLKMVLLHFINPKIEPKNILNKYYQFEKFLIDELGLLLAKESNLALYYFSNLAGKFIGIQSRMSLSNAIKNLKSTAWDLFLLTIPEILLNPEHLPEMNLAYVVTSEKKLLEIGELFKISSLFYETEKSTGIPILSFNASSIENILGEKNMNELIEHKNNLTYNRIQQNSNNQITSQSLSWLIEDLEVQLSNLCRG